MWIIVLLVVVYFIIVMIPETQDDDNKYVNFLLKRYQRKCDKHVWGYKATKGNEINTLVCRVCGYRPEEQKFDP